MYGIVHSQIQTIEMLFCTIIYTNLTLHGRHPLDSGAFDGRHLVCQFLFLNLLT